MQPTVLLALALSAAAPAQVQLRVFAHTDLAVMQHRIPAGTDISGGAWLSWSDNHPLWPSFASMAVYVTATSVRFDNSVSATLSMPPTIAPHSIRVHLSSPTTVDGTLHVEGGVMGTSFFRVDVGDDGTVDLQSGLASVTLPAILEQTLSVGPGGLDVVLEGSAAASLLTFFGSSTVSLSFAPTGAHVTRSGAPCGAELAARYYREPVLLTNNRRFELAVERAPVTPYAFFVVGVTPLQLAIPPLGCLLRSDILVPLPATVDPLGRAALTLPVPATLAAFDARIQFVAATLDPVLGELWRTSEVVATAL
ncbi:MAG: hypothetical protein IPM29_18610 [Planctomycetes bacterium]|nr:hypothetical protein [Planctomycetota bacterium]